MRKKENWIGLKDFNNPKDRPAILAFLSLLIYFIFVISGAEIQSSMNVSWEMGWLQQLTGFLGALLFARIFKINKHVLGFNSPVQDWLLPTVAIGLSIGFIGVLKGYSSSPESLGADQSMEYYMYQAIAPGIGEEVGLRGLFLGCLFMTGAKKGWNNYGGWWTIIIHAIPFGLLHLLERSGVDLLFTFLYTTFAAVLLGHLRIRTASIIPCIIAHNLANLTSGIVDLLY